MSALREAAQAVVTARRESGEWVELNEAIRALEDLLAEPSEKPVMSNINDGGPVSPNMIQEIPMGEGFSNYATMTAQGGLSIRDWFAGMAMQGAIGSKGYGLFLAHEVGRDGLAIESYEIADAMLAARSASKPQPVDLVLWETMAVIRTIASEPHHPNALKVIREMASNAINKAEGRDA